MRKIKLFIYAVILNFLFTGSLFAQLSYGGKPLSFNKKIDLQKSVQTMTMLPINVALLKAEDLANENNKDIPWRFGKNINVNINMETSGTWDLLSNGDKLWRLRIYSQGALTMNFGFSKYLLPEGASLFLYNEEHSEVLGSFTSANNTESGIFATTLIPGEAITIEYYEPANTAFSGELVIDRVTHGYQNVFDFAAKGFGTSGNCQRNVACSPDSVGWSKQIRSACMLVVGGSGFCSGALINNSSNNGTPYVLTANHCSTGNDFAQWIFWFNWQSAACTNTTNPPHDQVTTSGCALRARNAGSDFCLVQMNSTPPCSFNPYYSGWSRSTTPATSAACIHHPDGDVKKISLSSQAAVSATYSGATCWQIFWTVGSTCTEPGSSGSPVYDQNHRIIGQLYGGPSACGAASGSMNDYYGQVATSWTGGGTSATRLSDWLDPSGTAPQFIDGYDPCLPSLTLDAELNSITNPVATYCASQSIIPTVVIKNNGTTTLTSLSVRYNIDGGANVIQAWTGSLATGAIATVTFPSYTLAMGTHTFNASCTLPNGGTDLNLTNDTKTISYTVSSGQVLPFTEDFESTTFPPTNWSLNNPDGGTTWVRKATTGNGASTASASIDFFNYNSPGQTDDIITPSLLLPAGGTQMTFNVAYRQYQTENDRLQIFISTDCGVTYNATPIYDKAGAALATTTASTAAFSPTTAAQWRMETVDLSAFANNSVKIKFVGTTQYGNNLHIDDINIQSLSTPPVADFIALQSSVCSGGVQFTDISTNLPTSWLWDFGDGQTSTLQNPSYNYSSNGTFNITLTATNAYGSDQVIKTGLITINMPASPSVTSVSNCGPAVLTLSATGGGILHWFDAPSAGTDLGTGTTFTTPLLSTTTTYYVASHISQPSQYVGPLANFAAGQYSNTSYSLIFNCISPFTLVSVAVNKQVAGSIVIQLTDAGGTVLQTGTFTVPVGASRITLNWPVAIGTGLRLVGPANSGLWRVNTPGTYPYSIAGLVSITGCSSGTRCGSFFDWEVKEADCESARVPVVATINTQVTPTISISASTTTICPGDPVTFTATATDGGLTPSYQWQLNGTNVGPNSPTVTTAALNNNDIATCILTSSNSCVTSATAMSNPITITFSSATPIAAFTYTNTQLDFSFTSTSTGATTYLWDFGDGQTSTLQNPLHTYANSGLYTVTLTVTSSCGTNNVTQSVNAIGNIINSNNAQIIVNLYPNPAKTIANLVISGVISNEINIEISDILGRPVFVNKYNSVTGKSKINLDLTNLEKGIYFIEVIADNNSHIIKLIHE